MEVFFYNDDYSKELAEFISKVWNRDMTEDRFLEKRQRDLEENPYGKEGGFPIAIATNNNGKIVGHHAATPCQIWANGTRYLSYWLAGLNVLPEARRQGLATRLQTVTNQIPVATSFWVVEATLRVKKKLGWTIVGKVPEYVKILNARKLASKFNEVKLPQLSVSFKYFLNIFFCYKWSPGKLALPILVWMHNRVVRVFWQRKNPKDRISTVTSFDKRVDELWNKNTPFLKYAQVRKSGYLNWRFKEESGWIKVILEQDSRISGYVIASLRSIDRTKNQPDISALSIIDLFWDFDQPDVLYKLVNYVEDLARSKDAAVLVCSINNKVAGRLLLRNAFVKIPSTVYFGFHTSEGGPSLSSKMEEWFITRGDADADGSLGVNKQY